MRKEQIIKNYAHDYRDMKMSEKELEKMLTEMLFEINENCLLDSMER